MAQANSPGGHVLQVLDAQQPDSLVCICAHPLEALAGWQAEHPECRITQCPASELLADPGKAGTHDLAIVCDTLEHLDHETGLLLLGTLRNRVSQKLYLLVNQLVTIEIGWQDTDFFSLGLRHAATFRRGELDYRAWVYDIGNYNPRREWNNPDHWANPENWGKYWW